MFVNKYLRYRFFFLWKKVFFLMQKKKLLFLPCNMADVQNLYCYKLLENSYIEHVLRTYVPLCDSSYKEFHL